ncbi:hypothetical protein Tco_0773449 [Tanacetum coccineum]|uniref:Uncharacterized protein n=1 Tax=Tanacetum coccineum TaxID=301880 RepID=A0ABQ4ZPR5_9ASTR
MANIRTCNKHNMIACVEKTEHNADFHQIIDYLAGCSINYSLLVDPDLIGPWLQQFWATASLRVINEVSHIRPSPQWKYLVHVLLHCLSPKSTSWEQFGTNIASALDFTLSKNSPNSSGRITSLTPPMLEVVTALAAEEGQSTASSPRVLLTQQGTAQYSRKFMEAQEANSFSSQTDYQAQDQTQETVQIRTASGQTSCFLGRKSESKEKKKEAKKNPRRKCLQSNWGGIRMKAIVDKEALFTLDWKRKKELELEEIQVLAKPSSDAALSLNISRPRGLSIPGPIQSQPQQPTQASDPKDKGKGILVEEPKKKKLTLQQIRALETTNDEEVARKIQAEWDAEEERKRLEELKKAKPKTILKKPTSLAQERNQMMNFLKGQGYKNLQKLRYPQMKELYDKVQESIIDSHQKILFQWAQRKKSKCCRKEMQRDS